MTTETIAIPTIEEVRQRFLEKDKTDMFGFESHEYAPYCGWNWLADHGYLKKDAEQTKESVAELSKEIDRDSIIKEMEDYMSFAFEKANDMRGLSANRSIMHYIAWTWLSGERHLSDEINRALNSDYQHYGKEILRSICEHYGWDWHQWDNGVLTNG